MHLFATRPGPGRRLGVLVVVFAALLLTGCASKPEPYVERPVDKLYNAALNALLAGQYDRAAKAFEEVERQHPYSVWAVKAQVMAAYANYQANNYDEAILAARRFVELHPGNRDVAYAYYLIAISYYEQISDIGRDQKMTRQALASLEEVVRRFPDSEYARDARLKIDLAHDHLAGKEMEVGRFYERKGRYTAAINRFRNVVENYQTTTHVPEALHRLVECYLAIGLVNEAQTAAAVLGHNFPGSEWYQDSYALLTSNGRKPEVDKRSWLAQAMGSIF